MYKCYECNKNLILRRKVKALTIDNKNIILCNTCANKDSK